MGFEPNLTKQHLKAVIFKSYIIFLRKFYPQIDIAELCKRAGLSIEYLLHEDNWVSIKFEEQLMTSIKNIIKDESLLYKVGKFGTDKNVVGKSLHFLCFNLFTLQVLYESLPFVTSLLNKVMRVEIQEKSLGKIVLRISPNIDDLNEEEKNILLKRMPDFIENTVGYYSAIPLQKNLTEAKISVELIQFENIPTYIIDVVYPIEQTTRSNILKLSPVFVGAVAFIYSYLFVHSNSINSFSIALLCGSITYILLLKLKLRAAQTNAQQTQDTLIRLDNQYKIIHQGQANLSRKYQESSATNMIVDILGTASSESDMLDKACQALVNILHYDRAAILIANIENTKLEYGASCGLDSLTVSMFQSLSLDVNIHNLDPNKISNVFRSGNPVLIENVDTHISSLIDQQSRALLTKSKSKSFIAVPIKTDESKFGIVISDCYQTDKKMTKDDLLLLCTLGKQLAIALERERAKQGLVQVLNKTKELAESYSRFVPWESLQLLNYTNIFDVKIGDGVEKEMTILFSDIREFTKLCESMTPVDTLKFLNSYFGKLSPIIKKHKGVIDKFIGDCVMAIFNDPDDAIAAAIEIQRSLVAYNLERRVGNRSILEAGIGLCKGQVVAGPLGFDGRLEITVLSDTVNIASRLDGLCKAHNARILASGIQQSSKSLLNNIVLKNLGKLGVKGKDKMIDVIEIVDPYLTSGLIKVRSTEAENKYIEKVDNEIIEKLSSTSKRTA